MPGSDVNFPGFRWDFPFSLDLWQKCGIWESGIWDFDPMFDLGHMAAHSATTGNHPGRPSAFRQAHMHAGTHTTTR